MPTPKKSRSGVCKMDEYSGISRIFGISSIYKAICGIIQGMLTQVVGEWNLVVDPGVVETEGCLLVSSIDFK